MKYKNKTKKEMPKTLQNGEPWILESGIATTDTCCDCGLEHMMIAEIKEKKIHLRFYRDDYQTKKNRRTKWKNTPIGKN